MNLDFTPADETFRKEVRSFIAENLPKSVQGKSRREYVGKEDFMAWHKALYQKGWVARKIEEARRQVGVDAFESRP